MDLRLPDYDLCDGLHRNPDAWLESAVARASALAFTCQGPGRRVSHCDMSQWSHVFCLYDQHSRKATNPDRTAYHWHLNTKLSE
jgi:hypothetical protein